jgi:hypothetical protein
VNRAALADPARLGGVVPDPEPEPSPAMAEAKPWADGEPPAGGSFTIVPPWPSSARRNSELV